MTITVNGRRMETADGTNLHDFVSGIGLKSQGVIAELNRNVVARERWKETFLYPGDNLELVSLVGGG